MKQSRIVIAAAAAAMGVLFTAPTVATATPLTPIGSQALATETQHANAIEKVAVRHRVVTAAQNRGRAVVVPIVQDVPQQIGVRAARHAMKEIARDELAPVGHSLFCQM